MSQSGKTSYIEKILIQRNGLFTIPVSKVVYCYNVYQEKFSSMSKSVEGIVFYQGLPDRDTIETWARDESHLVIVFDDMYFEVIQSKAICDLIIMLSHHLRITSIMTSHNIFMNARFSKTIATNLHYILLFTLRNRLQISVLGSQLMCHKAKARNFVKVYDMAVGNTLGNPLIIDNSPKSVNRQFALRTNCLVGEHAIVYEIN